MNAYGIRLAIGTALACFTCSTGSSCHAPHADRALDRQDAIVQIREIEDAWAQVAVTGDPTIIDDILADDFVGISPDGVPYTKREFILDTKTNPLGFQSNELDDMTVRFVGDVAIAHGSETFTRADGERGRFVWTDVLVRSEGRWRIVAAQDAMTGVDVEPAQGGLFTEPTSRDEEAIDRTRNAYVAAWRAADVDRIARLYTEGALVLYPNQPAVRGRSAILDYFRGFFEEFPTNEFELISAEIVVDGAWAFDRGTYRWKGTPRAGGAAVEDNGKYLVVLERQANGEWRVARDMDNSDRPATQSTREAR